MRLSCRCRGWVLGLLCGLPTSWAAVAMAQPAVPAANPDESATDPAVAPPRLVRFVHADYPPEAAERGLEATVELELTIDETGAVTDVRVVSPAGHGFDEAAQGAARRFEFAPARQAGQPVPVRIRYRYVFELRSEAPTAAAPTAQARGGGGDRGDTQGSGRATESAPTAEGGVPNAAADEDGPTYGAVAEIEAPRREVTRHRIDKEQMTRVPGTRGDPIRAVEIMPGVGRSTQTGDPILRGTSMYESQVFLDGAPIPFLYHFGSITSVVQPKLLESVDVYPGNFSVRYGRVTGGVVDVRLRDLRTESWGGVLDVSFLDVGAMAEVAVTDRFAFALAGRRSIIDYLLGAMLSEEDGSVVAAPAYYDYQALATYRFDDHQLKVLGYGSHDDLALHVDNASSADPTYRGDFDFTFQFHRIQASLLSQLTEDVEQELMVAFGGLSADQQWGAEWDSEAYTYELHGRGEWRARLTPRLRLTFGLDVETEFQEVVYTGPRPPPEEGNAEPETAVANWDRSEIEDTYTLFRPAAYVELGVQATDRLLLVPGLRFDYYDSLEDWTLNPRMAARYALSDDMTVKGGVGLFSQQPLWYLSIPVIGNPELEPYHALQSAAGVEYQLFDDMVALGVEGFYKYLFNRPVATEGEQPPYFINDGIGHIFGAELSALVRPTARSFGMLAYTISRSERSDRDEPTRLFDHDQTHILSLAANVDFGSGWEAGGRFRFISGNPEVPVEGAVYNANVGVYRPIYGAPFSVRKPPFHQLDLRLQKTWQFESWSLAAYVDVQNVYNHTYGDYVAFSYDYTESERVGGMGIFPNIGLRGEI